MSKRTVKKTMILIFVGIGAVLFLTVGSLFMISGIFEDPTYLEPWQKEYSQKYDDPRIQLVAHGLLAANGHNMQPWKIQLDKENPMAFYLYADSGRLTNEVDPDARQMMITQGAFLEYVKIAGSELGYKTEIEFFPNGGYNEQELKVSMDTKAVAKIVLIKGQPQKNAFYEFLFLPDTNRAAYQPEKLTSAQMSSLQSIDAGDNMLIEIFQDEENTQKLGQYVMQGAVIEAGVSRVMQETDTIFRANEYQKNKYRSGFSIEGQGTSGMMKHILQGLVTIFPSFNRGESTSNMMIQSTQEQVNHTSAYAMVLTDKNDRLSQLKSGMLYSRLIITAHQSGLVMQPLSQVLEEYPEMKKPYDSIHREYASNGSTIQMLVRLGKPTKEVPQSMRREVMDLIIKE